MLMGSYSFDGTDDYIEYQANLAALSLTQYLVLAWVKRTGGHANGRICQRGAANSTTTDHMQLMTGDASDGVFRENFSARQDTATTDGRRCAGPIDSDQFLNDAWYAIGVSYIEGTSMLLWKNGASQAFVAGSAAGPTDGTTTKQTDKFYIGSSGGSNRAFGGKIAALGIWDTSTLNSTDIEDLVADYYNSGSGTIDIPRQDVLVDFVLLQASGEIDGEDGVLTGTASGASFDSGNSAPVQYNGLGATPVSNTWALSYNIQNSVSRTWALSYNLLNAVSREWSLRYNLLNAVSSQWDLSYNILNAISREWSLSYEILEDAASVSRSWALSYNILNAISREWTIRYDILNAISREWGLSYQLVNAISREWALRYDIANVASREWALRYNIGDVVAALIDELVSAHRAGIWQPDVYTVGRRL